MRRRALMLTLATVGFAVNFWAWALLSPLGPRLKAGLHLSAFQQALLVAVPVVVGSLGRIPVGALTDRFGGRIMFPLISAVTILPVLYLGLFGHSSPTALLVGGFFSASAERRSRSGCRSSAPGSRPSVAAWRSGSSGRAWAAPPSVP
jgi:NNP family nitrate/nitrite transporter-like MFS transporter